MNELELCNLLNEYSSSIEKRIPPDKLDLARAINRELIDVMKKHVDAEMDISTLCLSTALFVCISHQLLLNIDVNS